MANLDDHLDEFIVRPVLIDIEQLPARPPEAKDGVSAASIRRLLFNSSSCATKLYAVATDLTASVQFDDTGAMVAGQLRGGNGGLLSRETIHKAGLVQLTLNDIKKLPALGKEG